MEAPSSGLVGRDFVLGCSVTPHNFSCECSANSCTITFVSAKTFATVPFFVQGLCERECTSTAISLLFRLKLDCLGRGIVGLS